MYQVKSRSIALTLFPPSIHGYLLPSASSQAKAMSLDDTSEEQGAEDGSGRSWWQWSDQGPDGRPSRATQYSGWDRALQESLIPALRLHK